MDDLDELLRDEDEDEDEDDAKSSVETGDEDNGDDAKSNENSEDEASVETPEAVDAGGETAEDEPYDTADDDAPDDEDEDMGAEAGPMDMLRFIQAMPEADVRRHEQFRRSHFDKNVIKRCMTQVIEEACVGERRVPPVHNAMCIVMSGLAKMFLGELIAEARKIMAHAGDDGPIRPHHLREAHRKYYKRHPLIRGRNRRRLLK